MCCACRRKQRYADGTSYACVVFFFNRKMTISKNALKLSSKTLSSLTERSKCGGYFLERKNTFFPVLSQKSRVPEPEGQEHLAEVLALCDRCQPRSSGGASLQKSSAQGGGQDQWVLTTAGKENMLQGSFWGLTSTYDTPPVHPYCPLVHLAFRGCYWEDKSKERGKMFCAHHELAVEVLALKQLLPLVAEVGQAVLLKAEACRRWQGV